MKIYKPTTPGRRGMRGADFSKLTKKKPERALVKSLKKKSGRNLSGRITTRHRGGGAKRLYRVIEFKQTRMNEPAKVVAIEYDPNRFAFIALLEYKDKKRKYILAPQDMEVGDDIVFAEKTELKPGNRMKLKNIPAGTMVHNIELVPNMGGKMARGAGTSAKVLGIEGKFTHLEMPSSEVRKVPMEGFASIGSLSNAEHRFIKLGKAGRNRHMGKRPTVRGSAMNACDHPMGGGEGRAGAGMPHPKTPWGKPALGKRTRKKKKQTNRFIIKRRKIKKKK
jgi:large subunit ribosomal protein L2